MAKIIRSTTPRTRRRPATAVMSALRGAMACILGAKLLRPMQMQAYIAFLHSRLMMLIAPPGSGKTLTVQTISMDEVRADPTRRVLIAAPYRDIGRGFKGGRIAVGKQRWAALAAAAIVVPVCAWVVKPILVIPTVVLLAVFWRRIGTSSWCAVNKCDDTDDAVRDVEAFIRGGSGIMVCCHSSLARAWARVADDGPDAIAAAIHNLTLWIDEAHRVEATKVRQNGIGRMVHAMVRCDDETARVGLATATFCRANCEGIVDRDDADEFTVFRCPMDVHLRENVPSIRSIACEYVQYDPAEGWDDSLAALIREKGRRTLIYVPSPTTAVASPESGGVPGKLRDLARVVAAIERVDPAADIVDLVTDCGGVDNSEELRRTMDRIADGDDPDYIIALQMMKMGSDWPNLRSIADLAPSDSRPETGQKFGRLTREPAPGIDKKNISYTYFFRVPSDEDDVTDEDVRRVYSARHAALVAILLLEYDIAMPFGGARNPAFDWSGLKGFLLELTGREGGTCPSTCIGVARSLMDERHVPDDIRQGLDAIVRRLHRPRKTKTMSCPGASRPSWGAGDLQAMELVDAGYDEVQHGEIGMLTAMTTGARGIGRRDGMFDRFRVILRGIPTFSEEQVAEAIRARMADSDWRLTTGDKTQIPGLPPGTSCSQLDQAIRVRCRGFVLENDSLLKLLRRHGVLPPEQPHIADEQAAEAIAARMKAEKGWRPSVADETQIPGLPPWTSCKRLDSTIKDRSRRQRRQSLDKQTDTLAKMLRRHGVLHHHTEKNTIAAIKARMESEPGWQPHYNDTTQIPGLPPGGCKHLDGAIRGQRLGFDRDDDTLVRMLQRHGLLPPDPPTFTEEQIISAIRARMESESGWVPNVKDGTQIPGLMTFSCRRINAAIRDRRYGFDREDDSLFKMMVRNGVLDSPKTSAT